MPDFRKWDTKIINNSFKLLFSSIGNGSPWMNSFGAALLGLHNIKPSIYHLFEKFFKFVPWFFHG